MFLNDSIFDTFGNFTFCQVRRPLFGAFWGPLLEAVYSISPTFVLQNRLRVTFRDDHALIHDIGAIAYPQRLLYVVISNQYANSDLFEVADDPLNVAHGYRVYTCERLVQQDESGLRCQ